MDTTPKKHHRRSIRLKDYDYSQVGAYFVTVCVKNLRSVLGNIENGEVKLSTFGGIVKEEWLRSSRIRREIELDEYVIMPNHFHAIVFILDMDGQSVVGANGCSPLPGMKRRSLSSLMAGVKSAVTARVNRTRGTPGAVFWQRNYYEHIVRTETSLNRVREYVYENPLKWELDRENPDRIGVNRAEELWFGKAVPRR